MRLPELLVAARRTCRDPDITDAEWIDYANEAMRAAANRVFMPDFEAAASVSVAAGATSVALPGDYQRHLWSARNADGAPLAVLRSSADMERLRIDDLDAPAAIRSVAAVGHTLQVWPAPEEAETLYMSYFRLPHTLDMVSGKVTFSATDKTLTAATGERLFSRFHAGDVFVVSGSSANDAAFTVVSVTETVCVVSEAVSDENSACVGILAGTIEGIPDELQRTVLVNSMLAEAYETAEDALDGKGNTDRFRALAEKALKDLKVAIISTGYQAPSLGHDTARIRALV